LIEKYAIMNRCLKKLLFFILLFSILEPIQADVEFNPGEDYIITGEGIVSFQEEFIAPKTRIRIQRVRDTSIDIEILSSNLTGTGQYHTISSSWLLRSTRELTTFELVSNAISVLLFPPILEIQPDCSPEDSSQLAPVSSVRPPKRPLDLTTGGTLVKGRFDVASYFDCYRSNQNAHETYVDQYSSAIRRISSTFSHDLPELSEEQTASLMACLLFRESAHWQGVTSDTGAVGLGQFTGIAINQVQSILRFEGRDNFNERRLVQRSELEARRIDQNEYENNLELIEAEERNYNRMTELKSLWNRFELRQRPSANQIDRSYLADNENHEAIFALSAILVRECQLRTQENNIAMNDRLSLLACLGAYNMGYGAFSSNAFNRSGEQSPQDWVENLLKSDHHQRQETANHLISIMRCSEPGSNYPPCGTRNTYCRELPNTNPCADQVGLLCSGECS
jgi:hypothetical protein